MATGQIITPNSTSGALSSVITTTKIRIESNVSCYFAVGNTAPIVVTSTADMLLPNAVRYINMEGVGNKINLVAISGTALVSIINCGYVDGTRVTY
jgi:hypothetical protein